ncbi:interleukin-1 receptor-like 1 isoform X2 [Seriola aureovittata]|uniref:interleukin-1 receptor-like 1 isoform X2 n=1 Tax=Seriola aureovittata TaxID=2871759 RepID=UPI0024BE9A9F|nr:interleukin-1 receptor-like 1 isoform X2 [Seriola aureovittata]
MLPHLSSCSLWRYLHLNVQNDLPHNETTWYKTDSKIEYISSDKKNRVHYHGGELFFLNLQPEDSGLYTARHINSSSGKCRLYKVKLNVHNAHDQRKYLYGEVEKSDNNIEIECPDPVKYTCEKFGGDFTWYKDFNLLQGNNNLPTLWVKDADKNKEGIYTCMCTWPYNHKMYNSSGSRKLKVLEKSIAKCEILSPVNKEQFANEGFGIKLNCSVYCGINFDLDCKARWQPANKRDGYNTTTKLIMEDRTKNIISTAVLTIDKVSAKDFLNNFECIADCYYERNTANLTLKRRESVTPLIVAPVCVLFVCAFAAVLVKCFAIDLALFFRRFFPLSSHRGDARLYDAYVVYQMQSTDKVTEETLSQFVTQILPSVLEKKCGYRLFIHGRDDIPGEDRLELVEDSIEQSRRLMVVLTPGSGSKPEITDQCPASTQNSVIGGFDWQVGIHHALVQREMSVILIQLGDTGPQGYTDLPVGLQHLIRKSAPLKWPNGSRGAAAWNSRFWKRVRYLMPATPARKCSPSAII